MLLISHRGNINGKIKNLENHPSYIDNALSLKYDVEIDIWCIDNQLYLGHDYGEYLIDDKWILDREDNLWVHCKNVEAINHISIYNTVNYFWHENDTITLTSKKYIWVNPGKQPIQNSIAVLPELYNEDVSKCLGVCSDYIKKY
jgi:hypothetical protein